MPKALTAVAVEKLRPKAERYEVRDGGARGLRVVVYPSGSKSWAMRFRKPDGKTPAKLILGPVDLSRKESKADPMIGAPMTLAAARKLCADVQGDRARGKDVVAEHQAEKRQRKLAADESNEATFEGLARRYILRHAKPTTRRWKETARTLGLDPAHDALPVIKGEIAERWARRLGASITRADVVAELDRATDRAPTAGNKVKAALSSMFRWHAKRGTLDVVPTALVASPVPLKKMRRSRRLTEDELRILWRALDECVAADEVPAVYAGMVRFILLTAVRRDEARKMSAIELAVDGKSWTVPGPRTKNGLEHLVPLSPQACEILRKFPAMGKTGLIFTLDGHVAISNLSRLKRKLSKRMIAMLSALAMERDDQPALARWDEIDRLLEMSVNPKASDAAKEAAQKKLRERWWHFHDLRRNARSFISTVATPDIAERVIGHVKDALRATYDLHQFELEKGAALRAWAREVDRIVSGKGADVLPLRTRRR